MALEEELFIAQYNQVWQQKRHHDNHIWSIPSVVAAVVSLTLHAVPFSSLSLWGQILFYPLALGFLTLGVIRLVFRHVFFETAYTQLIRQMDTQKQALLFVPQSQDDKELCNSYLDQLDTWARFGARCRWKTTRLIFVFSLVLFALVFADHTDCGSIVRNLLAEWG